jgi:integrase
MHLADIRAPLGLEKQGIGRQFRALGFHSLRHSFISTLANSEVPADVRKQIVGHSSEDIHRRYVHLGSYAPGKGYCESTQPLLNGDSAIKLGAIT